VGAGAGAGGGADATIGAFTGCLAFFAASFAAASRSFAAAANFAASEGVTLGLGVIEPGTNTLVVEVSLGDVSGAGAVIAGVFGAATGALGVAGVPLLRVNNQMAAAIADSATPPMMSGILPELDPPLVVSKVDARNDEGGAAAAESPLDAASPYLANLTSVDSTSGCGNPLIEESESIDIGVLRSASSLRCRTESAAPRTVVSSCASVVALQIAFASSAPILTDPTPKFRSPVWKSQQF
jgi:hypothetical protein